MSRRKSKSEKFGLTVLKKQFPSAYQRLPSSYRAVDVLDFRTESYRGKVSVVAYPKPGEETILGPNPWIFSASTKRWNRVGRESIEYLDNLLKSP